MGEEGGEGIWILKLRQFLTENFYTEVEGQLHAPGTLLLVGWTVDQLGILLGDGVIFHLV
jgi:hypothetical protein